MIGLGNRGFELEDYSEHLVNVLKKNGYYTVLSGIQHEYGHYKDKEGYKVIGYDECVSDDYNKYESKNLNEWDENNIDNLDEFLLSYDERKPLFISVGFHSTHRQFPESDSDYEKELPKWLVDAKEVREDYSKYVKSLKNFDESFGKLINILKKRNLFDDSLIIFTTDHGIAFPDAKCTLRDSGIGVGLAIKNPDAEYIGRYRHLISQVDIMPTLIDLLGLECDSKMDGVSFKDVFKNREVKVRDYIMAEVNFHCAYEPCRCIRTEDYKYIVYYGNYQMRKLANIDNSISKNYYINHDKLRPRFKNEFYDLKIDENELSNITKNEEYSNIKNEVRKRLYNKQVTYDDDILEGLEFKHQKWIVNTNSCEDPHSKNPKDLI
jgi:arylsulfatase A-like enzyme